MKEVVGLEITDYGYSGEGVGKIGGRVCFIPYALKDEIVEGEVVKKTSSFYKLKLINIKKTSPLRIPAPCPYFAKCGGCAFQCLEYANELKLKCELVKNQFKKVGYEKDIEIVESSNQYGYRNKIKLFCKDNKLALFENGSNVLVPVEKCLLVEDEINQAIENVQTFVEAKDIGRAVDNIYIRSQGKGLLVWFKFKRQTKLDFTGLQIMLGANSGIFTSVGNSSPQHQTGLEVLKTTEFDLNCEFEVDAFHQVNNKVAEKLYQEVINLVKGNKVINGYSGAGVLSGILAKQGKTVYGIELGLAEHQSAEKLKEQNGLSKLFNIHGDCASLLGDLISSDMKTMIIDPPRAGIDKKICDSIDNSKLDKVVYISCDTATLVRDIMLMSNFEVETAKVFDMFPCTGRVEVLCVLKKKSKNI